MSPLRRYITTPIRQWLSDQKTVRKGRQQLRTHHQAYYGFWKPQEVSTRWFTQFLQRPAFRELARPAKINFFSVFCRRRLLSMVGDDAPRIFFTGENLANYPAWNDHALDEVDLALGFAHLPAKHYQRFPLWLMDIFPPEADLPAIKTTLNTLNEASADCHRRPGFAALIARHDTNGIRGKISDLVAHHGRVDYPGKFRNNLNGAIGPGYPGKLTFLRNYAFNICPENSDAEGYVTEKIWHAIAAGCIPIYWGSGNQPEAGIINPAAMLTFDPAAPELLTRQLDMLTSSQEQVIAFARQPRFLPGAAEVIYQHYDDLEISLLKILSR